MYGGEGGILLPPIPTNSSGTYTSAIIPLILTIYKPFRWYATVSAVSLIRPIFNENGISSITANNTDRLRV